MRKTFARHLALIISATQSGYAMSQTHSANTPALEEVLVTATRREENVRDIAANVGVFSGEYLRSISAKSFEDYLPTLPGVSLHKIDPQQSTISVRGVTTSVGATQTQQPTGIYIDEMPFTDPFSFFSVPDLTPFDLERIELLRGPQGTLYGSASLGGALRYITQKPDLSSFAGRVSVEGSSTADSDGVNSLIQGMVNIPLLEDALAVRVVVSHLDNAGYADNLINGQDDWNSYDQTSGRILVKYAANDQLTINASAIVQETNLDGTSLVDDTGGLVSSTLAMSDTQNRYEIYNANFEWSAPAFSVLASSTFAAKDNNSRRDAGPILAQLTASGFAAAIGAAFNIPAPPLTAAQSIALDERESESWAHEIRVTSASTERWNWLFGAFYQTTDSDLSGQTSQIPGLGAQIDQIFPGLSSAFLLPGDATFELLSGSGQDSEELAVFGEVEFELSDTLSLELGGRYFDINTDTGINILVPGIPGGIALDTGFISSSDEGFNPKVSISWRPTESLLLYSLVSKGYRVGGANVQSILGTTLAPTEFESDTLWNYEIGIKSEWLDGRLTLDATVFFLDWTDIQLEGLFFAPALGSLVSETRNAGEAHSFGLEASLSYQVNERLSFTSSLAVTEAELDEDSANFLDPITRQPALVREGSDLPGTPDFQIANRVRYEWPMSESTLASIVLTHQYVGDGISNIAAPSLTFGDYHSLGLRFAVDLGAFDASLFANNLADERGVMVTSPATLPGIQPNSVGLLTPRTIGITLNYEY